MTNLYSITTCCKLLDQASILAKLLLAEKCVACCHISSVMSLYMWEGALCEEQEYMLQCTTTQKCVPYVQKLLEQHHPYKVPQITAIAIEASSTPYTTWVQTLDG